VWGNVGHNYGATVAFTYVENIEDPRVALDSFDLPNVTAHPLNLLRSHTINPPLLLPALIAEHGRIDILLNNAAVRSGHPSPPCRMTLPNRTSR